MKEARRRFVSLALVAALFSGLVAVEAKDKAKIVAEKANVMLGEKVIAVLEKGAEFEIIGRHQQWVGLRVNVDGQLLSGWIHQRDCQVLAAGGMSMTFGAGDGKKTVPVPHLLAVVRAKGINKLVANAQQMAMEINPMLAGFVSTQGLAMGLGWQGMEGVDGDAPLALLILNPDKFDSPGVGLIPVTDYDQFSQVGGPSPRSLGKFALIGEDAEAMDAVAGALEGILAIPIDDMKGDVEIRVDLNAVMKALEPHLDEFMSQMSDGVNMMGQMGGGGGMDPEALGAVVKAEVDWLLNMARESSEATFSLSLSKEGIRTNSSLTAKEGAKLAQWFSSVPAASHKLAALLPAEEALMTFSGELGRQGWTDLYLDIVEKLLPAFKVGTEDGKKIVDSTRTLLGAMDGSMAASMDLGKNGVSGVFCMGAKGGAALRATMRDAMKSMDVGRLNEFYKQMGMPLEFQYKPAARTSNGIEIDVLEYAFKAAEGGNENPIVQQQMKMMKAMYGEKVTYEIACLEKMVLMVIGKDGSQTMDTLIPRAQQLAGGSTPPAIRSVQTVFGPDGQFYGAFSLKRMVEMVELIMSTAMPAMGGGAAPAGPAIEIPGPPIGICGKAKGLRAEIECFIPVKPMQAIQAYFIQKQAQQMQQQGGDAPDGGNPPPPMTF